MMKQIKVKFLFLWGVIKKGIQDPEVNFRFKTVLKIVSIPIFSFIVLLALLFLILTMDLIFFEAHGYPRAFDLSSAYYDFVFTAVIDSLPYFMIFLIIVGAIGFYIAYLSLRPFRVIGEYCESYLKGKKPVYDQEFFTDLKLLTSFSEYFFHHMDYAIKQGEYTMIPTMRKYQGIHGPVFERSYFINFLFFILITSILAAIGLYAVSTEIYMDVIKLSLQTLKADKATLLFLNKQQSVFQSVIWIVLIVHSFMYFFLSLRLYEGVSKPAFAIFATMRSFMKGNFYQRVHLIGHSYVRNQVRHLNKYLDYIEVNVTLKASGKLKSIKLDDSDKNSSL